MYAAASEQCYKSYQFGDSLIRAADYYVDKRSGHRIVAGRASRSSVMKLPLIAASVVAYTVLAMAWIAYAGLTPFHALF